MRPITSGHRLPRGGNNCDFCGLREVSVLHACRNFEWCGQQIFPGDTGHWAACWACSKPIDAGQWGRLTTRVMRQVAQRQGLADDEVDRLRASLRELHRLFGANIIKGEELEVRTTRYKRTMTATAD